MKCLAFQAKTFYLCWWRAATQPVPCGAAARSLKEAISTRLMPVDTCKVSEGENGGNVDRAGAHTHKKGLWAIEAWTANGNTLCSAMEQ